MRNLSLKKLIIALSAIISLVVIIQLIVLQVMQNDNQKLEKERVNSAKAVVLLKDIHINIVQIQQFLSDVSATGEEDGLKEADTNYKMSIERLAQLNQLLANHSELQSKVPLIQQEINDFYPLGISMAKAYAHQGKEAGNKLMESFDQKAERLAHDLGKLSSDLDQYLIKSRSAQQSETVENFQKLSILSIITFITLIISMFLFYRKIIPPISEFQKKLEFISTNSIFTNQQIDQSKLNRDEIGLAIQAFNVMIINLDHAMKSINQTMSEVSVGNFKHRIENTHQVEFHGDLKQLKDNINQTVSNLDFIIQDISQVMNAVAQNNFSLKVTAQAHGDLNILKTRINQSIERLEQSFNVVLGEINQVMSGIAQGYVNKTVQVQAEGSLHNLKEYVNHALSNLSHIIKEINVCMNAMANGDLRSRLDIKTDGQLKQLHDSINQSMQQLCVILSTIQIESKDLLTSANEIRIGYEDLSRRTTQQASALQEAVANMESLTQTVHHNSSNAQQANVMSNDASQKATKGGEMVQQVTVMMDQLHVSSGKIVDIIGLIDSIAFQTNILALNAAVEAARAGEQGKGFAVVANEVRTLAQRSATAAREIKELITNSVDQINDGVHLVTSAGNMINDMVQSINQVAQMISRIASSASEQNQRLSEINGAINQIDSITQQNVSLVEETAAVTANMTEKTQHLVESVESFRV